MAAIFRNAKAAVKKIPVPPPERVENRGSAALLRRMDVETAGGPLWMDAGGGIPVPRVFRRFIDRERSREHTSGGDAEREKKCL